MNRVRPAAESDYPVLLRLEQQLLAVHAAVLPGAFHPDGSDLSKRYFRRLISHPWSTVLVAESDGVPAAYTVIRLEATTPAEHVLERLPASAVSIVDPLHRLWSKLPWRRRGLIVNRRVAFIDSFVVGAEFRRQKIAETLWGACQEWARDRGADDIEFEVFELNQGILSFVEYLGLKPYKRRYSKKLSEGGEPGLNT